MDFKQSSSIIGPKQIIIILVIVVYYLVHKKIPELMKGSWKRPLKSLKMLLAKKRITRKDDQTKM